MFLIQWKDIQWKENLSAVSRSIACPAQVCFARGYRTVSESSFGTVGDPPSPSYALRHKGKTRFLVSTTVFTNRVKTTNICMTKIWLTDDLWNSRLLSISTLNVYLSYQMYSSHVSSYIMMALHSSLYIILNESFKKTFCYLYAWKLFSKRFTIEFMTPVCILLNSVNINYLCTLNKYSFFG